MPVTTPTQFCGTFDNVGSPFTAALTDNVPVGATALFGVNNEDGNPLSLTDTQGNTWVKVEDGDSGGVSGTFGAVFVAAITGALTAGVDTIEVTLSGAGQRPTAVGGAYWEDGSEVLDVEAENFGTGTSMSTGTTATTAEADSVAFAVYVMNDPATVTPDGAYTSVVSQGSTGGASSTPQLHIHYRILSAVATQNSTATRSAGGINWWAWIGVFPAAGGPPVGPVGNRLRRWRY